MRTKPWHIYVVILGLALPKFTFADQEIAQEQRLPLSDRKLDLLVNQISSINQTRPPESCSTGIRAISTNSSDAPKENLLEKAYRMPTVSDYSLCGKFMAVLLVPGKSDVNQMQIVRIFDDTQAKVTENSVGTVAELRLSGLVNELAFSPDCQKLLVSGEKTSVLTLSSKIVEEIPQSSGLRMGHWINSTQIAFASDNELKIFENKKKTWRTALKTDANILAYSINNGDPQTVEVATLTEGSEKQIQSKIQSFNLANPFHPSTLYTDSARIFSFRHIGENLIVERSSDSNSFATRVKVFSIVNQSAVIEFFGNEPQKIDDTHFIYAKREGSDEQIPYLYDLRTGKHQRINPGNKVGKFDRIKAVPGGYSAVLNTNFSRGEIIKTGLTGKSTSLFKAFDFSDGTKSSRMTIPASNGHEYPAYLFSPENEKTRGTVIYVHGGGCNGSSFTTDFPELEFKNIIKRGYAVLAINYRGNFLASNQFPFAEDRKFEQCGTDETDDIFSALKIVKDADPRQPVFLWGHSHGAYLANLAITRDADRGAWNGVITTNGMWNIRLGGGGYLGSDREAAIQDIDGENTLSTIPFEADSRFHIYSENPPLVGREAAEKKMNELRLKGENWVAVRFIFPENYYQTRNPILFVDKIKAPVLLLHSQQDEAVPYDHAKAFVDMAEKKALDIKTFLPPDDFHNLSVPKNFAEWDQILLNFLDSHSEQSKNPK